MTVEKDNNVGIDQAATSDLRSYGRRRGRKASPRQRQLLETLLPRLSFDLQSPPPADLTGLFTPSVREVWLEIGFGGGEHLLWQARANPDVGIVGAEPFEDGVVKVLDAVAREKLDNVRVLADDVRALLRWLPERSLTRAFILFPDPWPKLRHRKRRLFNPELVDLLTRLVRAGGELRAGTDIGDYAGEMLLAVAQRPEWDWTARAPVDWRARPTDWPETRYEQKALREGRRCAFLTFRRL